MTVDRNEVNQMAKFLMALGDNPEVLTATGGRRVGPETTAIAPPPRMVGTQAVADMAKAMAALQGNPEMFSQPISVAPPTELYEVRNMNNGVLNNFYNATENVISEAPIDRPLRHALVTEKTKHGARIGSWEIVVKESDKRKTYDVIHMETDECIAGDLMLYEAACGLAKALNEGKYINHKDVVELMRHEQEYTSAVNEMILYRKHLRKNPRGPRAGLYETRFEEAKVKAVRSRDNVHKLSESF